MDNAQLIDQLGPQNEQSNLTKQLLGNTELLAIVMDMVGSRLAPDNPFAGVGSTLAKSSLAAKEEQTRKTSSEQNWNQFMQMLTGKDQAGPTSVTVARDPAGTGGLQYNIAGFEGQQKHMEDATRPAIRSAEDFIKDFGGEGGF